MRNPTEYPFRSSFICGVGVTGSSVGPVATFVSLSMSRTLALENVPSAETSTVTLNGTPGPLLSVAVFTAWFATITTTLPSLLCTGSVSRSKSSVDVNCNNCDPASGGNSCPSQ